MADKIKKFLKTIAQIESSGGKNTAHKTVQEGIQAGSSAYGKYGIMPNTVRELSKSSYGKSIPRELASMPDTKIKEVLQNNPHLEEQIARSIFNKINATTSDPLEQAYMWNAGHNIKESALLERDIEGYPYVQKFLKENEEDPEFQKQLPLENAAREARRDFKRVSDMYNQQLPEIEIPFEVDETEEERLAKK